MSRSAALAVLAVTGAALTACAGDGTRVQPPYIGSYDPEMLDYAASKGAVLTEVVGNPFGVAKEELDGAVVGAMRGAHFGQPVTFTTTPPADYTSPYRIVMLFNPAPGAQTNRVCAEPAQPSAAQPGELSVIAAFCSKDTVVTSTKGRVSKPQGPRDAAFRLLIRRVTVELFPVRDPDQDRDPEWVT